MVKCHSFQIIILYLQDKNEVMNTLRGQTQAMAAAADREIDQMRTMALNMAWMIRQLTPETAPKYEPWHGTHFIR